MYTSQLRECFVIGPDADECGVCDGDGVMQACGCGSPGEFEIPVGDCDCEGTLADCYGDCGFNGEYTESTEGSYCASEGGYCSFPDEGTYWVYYGPSNMGSCNNMSQAIP